MVTIDAKSNAYLVNRYLAFWQFTKFCEHTQKPLYTKTGYKVQWQNIRHDLARFIQSGSALQYAYGLLGAILGMPFSIGAVSYDFSGSTGSPGAAGLNYPHTCSGNNRMLVGAFASDTSGVDATTAVYATLPMTRVDEVDNSLSNEMWYIASPKRGTHTFEISISPSNQELSIGAISFNGSNGTIANTGTAAANDTNPTVTIASAVGDMVVDMVGINASSGLGADASQTQYIDQESLGVSPARLGMSTKSGAASITMSWTSSAQPWGIIATNIVAGTQPADASSGPRFLILGM